MSSRPIRTGLVRPGPTRLREKVTSFPGVAHTTASAPAAEAHELWVGVHLPWLSIEALSPAAAKGPRAVVEMQGQTQYIVAVSEHAQRFGVRAGMGMAAALALVPTLEMLTRDPPLEKQLLEQIATRAHRFTPRVSLVPPDGLVLEVKGSLHLFGGAEALVRAFESDCHEAGVKPLVALAPTPIAALAGARAGKGLLITQPAHLIGQISPLSLLALRWPADVIDRLKQIGVYTIGEALRLPRAGFARRFGKAQLLDMDRLTGKDTDLRERFHVPQRFRRRHHLLYELEHHEAILSTLTPVLEELGEFLQARQCGITRLACLLRHRYAPSTRCMLRLAAPAANAKHFLKLLGERLATLSLPEPVRSIDVRSGALVPRAPVAGSLWQPGEHGSGNNAAAPELIEHLRARLGHAAVYGMRVLQSHRPETAWCAADPHEAGVTAVLWPAHRRPMWLLPAPQSLSERNGRPQRRGALKLLEGPERIETGWWDQREIARDYYVALDASGVRLWVFRDCVGDRGWFLQGVFG
jgi:protein ImuB